jgi:hypothetical protein
MRVLCINSKDRPSEIPISKWVKENEVYTVTKAYTCITQNNIQGYELAELSLDGCAPYKFYAASRFIPLTEEDVLEEVEVEKLLST